MSKSPSFGHSVFQGDVPAGLVPARRPWPVVAAGLFWLAAGLSAGYWVLQTWGRSPVTALSTTSVSLPVVDTSSVAQALGASVAPMVASDDAAPAVAATRYDLLGVVSDRLQQGAALIAVDGQPPKPYPVGAELEGGGMFLQSVDGRTVRLGPSMAAPHSLELTLPEAPEGA